MGLTGCRISREDSFTVHVSRILVVDFERFDLFGIRGEGCTIRGEWWLLFDGCDGYDNYGSARL